MNDSQDEEIPSQWVALKASAPSTRRPSHALVRPSITRESIFVSGFESDEFDQSAASTVNDDDAGPRTQPQLGAKETRAVNRLKLALLFLMVALAGTFAGIVFAYTTNEEEKNFTETFVVYSQQIEDAVQVSAQNRLEAVGALAFQIQTYVHDSNGSWPFVTVSFFEDRVYSMDSLTDAFDVLLFPVVSQKNRKAWEEYAVTHVHWINESYASQENELGESGQILPGANQTWFDVLWGEGFVTSKPTDFSSGISDQIFGGWDPKNDSIRGPYAYPKQELYFPQWQAAPMSWYLHTTINQNYAQFDDFYNSTILSMDTGNAIMGIAWTDRIVNGFITTMLYPIYRDIYPQAEGHTSSQVVAFLGADIYWKEYMTNIFQDESAGATVVIENNVDQVFTYKVSGASVTFVGEGDHHDRSYDDMEETFVFGSNLGHDVANNNTSSHSRAFLHQEWVQYTFRIYPSQDLEDNFHSSQPAVYTAVVLLVTLIVASTFFMYDYLVEHRQQVVLRTAERSDAIVSSLFPKNVKEQLYRNSTGESGYLNEKKQTPSKSQKEHEGTSLDAMDSEIIDRVGSTKPRASSTSIEGAVAGLQQQSAAVNPKLEGPPIAELYDEATVFFADLVGFTAWSSQRSPADVFTLLETCYGAFDVIAHRRGVFKVETIGDCYVAVSGIPLIRSDHAIIMAKFARDILHSLSVELGKLVPLLGSATASLAMRVGIHSGPVTAGVLRGERARFQLFGDTVNTAARMESTGLRNRIQLSQATADLLIKAGKQSWIIKRSDEVEAKGKGRMQTYWLKCSVSFPITKRTITTNITRQLADQTASESDEASAKATDHSATPDRTAVKRSSSVLDDTSTTEERSKEE